MKLSVVHDSEGKIVAASVVEYSDQPEAHNELSVDLDVPTEFDGMELQEFLPYLRVDIANRRFVSVRGTGPK